MQAPRPWRPPRRTRGASSTGLASELLEEAEVVLPEQADVGHAVAEHGDPLEPDPEGEAGDLLGVVADVAEHVRVDEPGAAEFDPAGVLAGAAAGAVAEEARDRELHRRLGEREEVRREAHLLILAEEGSAEMEQRPLQVAERDSLGDGEAFDLVEDREVLRLDRVAPIDAAERDHVDGRLARLHHADLRRRRLGAQNGVAVQVERVQRRAGDVARRHVERIEEVVGVLDLVAVDDLVAEADEDVLDLPADLRDQVIVAARRLVPGSVTSNDSSPRSCSSSTPRRASSRSANAVSSRSRSAFSVIPLSRSR